MVAWRASRVPVEMTASSAVPLVHAGPGRSLAGGSSALGAALRRTARPRRVATFHAKHRLPAKGSRSS